MAAHPNYKQREESERSGKLTDISQHILIHFTYIWNQTSHFRLKSGRRNENEYYVH